MQGDHCPGKSLKILEFVFCPGNICNIWHVSEALAERKHFTSPFRRPVYRKKKNCIMFHMKKKVVFKGSVTP